MSGVRLTPGLSQVLSVGDGTLNVEEGCGADVISWPPASPSTLTLWLQGSGASWTFGLGILELQVLARGVQGLVSSCCLAGDVVPRGRSPSDPGEGEGCGEAPRVTTATVTVCVGTDVSLTTGS